MTNLDRNVKNILKLLNDIEKKIIYDII